LPFQQLKLLLFHCFLWHSWGLIVPKRGVGMSERQYEAHAGISRGAIQKAKAAGRIVMHPDGSIDAAASDVRRAQATDPSKQRGR
jgi:hypothetical protein